MEEAVKVPQEVIEFAAGDLWTGLFCSSECRSFTFCRLTITDIEETRLGGLFEMDVSFGGGLSACRPVRSDPPLWETFDFSAKMKDGLDGEEVLLDVEFTPLFMSASIDSQAFQLPFWPISLLQLGPALVAMYSHPTPTCFYLLKSKRSN